MAERVLILGGTAEAAALARNLTERGVEVLTSLAGRTISPRDLPGRVRSGGFGGVAGLVEVLRAEAITVVIDATHPFAATISAHARAACDHTGIRRVQLRRPAWIAQPGDRWIEVGSLAEAAAWLPELGRRVFLTVGAGGLHTFQGCQGVWFLTRLITPPALALPGVTLSDRGPFTVAGETALMVEHRIDLLVTKASGGAATAAKLAAARTLTLPVLMIARPPVEPGPVADTVEQAVAMVMDGLGC
jgi:precorrin-6A/cobalt-precorrin-6A reductase